MNVVLRDCIEYTNNKPTMRLGRVIIRGSNIEFVSVDYARVAPDQVSL